MHNLGSKYWPTCSFDFSATGVPSHGCTFEDFAPPQTILKRTWIHEKHLNIGEADSQTQNGWQVPGSTALAIGLHLPPVVELLPSNFFGTRACLMYDVCTCSSFDHAINEQNLSSHGRHSVLHQPTFTFTTALAPAAHSSIAHLNIPHPQA